MPRRCRPAKIAAYNRKEEIMVAFANKLVAVMNKRVDPGVVMNALAHLCIGLGATIGQEALRLTDYVDGDGGSHPHISKMPFVILEANSNKIGALRRQAAENGLLFVDFTNTMTTGSYVEQIELTKQTPEAELIYYGIVIFGEWQKVSELTRKFSLWK
jgi:hypothetical protein